MADIITLPAYVPRNLVIHAEDGRLMATITTTDDVIIEPSFTPEEVILAIIKYSQRMATFQYGRHQQEVRMCLDGWEKSLDVVSDSLTPSKEN